jgi:hypothetical protein
VDFSKEAIELGKRREQEIFGFADQEEEAKKKAKSKSNNTSMPNQDIIESAVATKARVDVDERDKRAISPLLPDFLPKPTPRISLLGNSCTGTLPTSSRSIPCFPFADQLRIS